MSIRLKLKFSLNEVYLLLLLINIFSNIHCQAVFHFNPSAPPVYPMGLLPDGTKKRPFLAYASGVTFINMLTAGAPVSELSLKFKAGMNHPILGAVPLTVSPKIISFSPWDMAPSPNMSTNISFVGKYPVNASSLIIENCKVTFTPGSQMQLNDSLKGGNILLTIKSSEITFASPNGFFVKMKQPNMIKFEDVKMKRGAAKDIDGYFTFEPPTYPSSTTEISIKKLKFSGPPPGKDITKNNLLLFNDKVDCKTLEITESEIEIINVMGFNKESGTFFNRRSIINKSKFKNAGLFNYKNSKNGSITVSDITFMSVKLFSARIIQVITPTNLFVTEKINMIDMVFDLGSGSEIQKFPRFIITIDQIKEMHINNWYFSNVKSIYEDDKTPNILVQTLKPIINFNIFDVDIPDNFEVGSFIATFAKITLLKINKVKAYFSKKYYDKFEKEGKQPKSKRNNFISVYSGAQTTDISQLTVKNNVVTKNSFVFILNGIDSVKFSDVNAEGNLVSCDEDSKNSLITVMQPKQKLPTVLIKDSKFTKNYSVNGGKHPNYSSCFTFNGNINSAEVRNTKFTDNRANDKNFDNFDITAMKTTLDTMDIVSSTEDELKKKFDGISGNGGGFEIFGRGIILKKSNILCTSKSPNLKGKMRSYKIKKESETLIFKKVDDYYRFKC